MALPVSSYSQVQQLQPIQQNEGTSIPSGSVKEYKLGSAMIHDKIGGDVVTIKHWIGEDGRDYFQPFIHDTTLRNPCGPSIRRLFNGFKEEFGFVHSQDITFEMDGNDYIKITEIDGNATGIRYVDLNEKMRLDASEGYGYNAYPHKPISITEDEVRSKISKIPNLWPSSLDISENVLSINIIALYNSHGILVHVLNEDKSLITYCAAPGDESLALVPNNRVMRPLGTWTAIWTDAYDELMSCEGDLTTAQLNGDSAHYLQLIGVTAPLHIHCNIGE